MNIVSLILLALLVTIRVIEVVVFIKKVNKVCNQYDWMFVETNEAKLIDMLSDKNYHVTKEWSAYNFLFLKGPNPLMLFFSTKPLTLEAQYNKEAVEKLKQYEII
jgi:hypothetical protein